jgi:hypothetical protein
MITQQMFVLFITITHFSLSPGYSLLFCLVHISSIWQQLPELDVLSHYTGKLHLLKQKKMHLRNLL